MISENVLKKIFPSGADQSNSQIINKGIPDQVKKSLDQIFGIKNVVDKMPSYQQVVDSNFKFKDFPYPIMKARNIQKVSCIFVKLKPADPLARKTLADQRRIENGMGLLLSRKFVDGYELMWRANFTEKGPSFLTGDTEQITYDEDGTVVDSLKKLIPEFQKLFSEEGIATDTKGNRWKLVLN